VTVAWIHVAASSLPPVARGAIEQTLPFACIRGRRPPAIMVVSQTASYLTRHRNPARRPR